MAWVYRLISLFRLAFLSLRYAWLQTLVLVLASSLIMAVPLVTAVVLDKAQASLTARAESTPLLIGRQGSALDLSLAALYFTPPYPPDASMLLLDDVWDSGYADAIPLYMRYKAGGAPVVGTSLDYFAFRQLEVAQGRGLALLGEAVLGATVAETLGLAPGDRLLTQPENLFDLGGTYPLQLDIVGVLAPTATPDDTAVFVDMKTAWVIGGIGHGHDDVLPLDADITNGAVLAAAGIKQFARITDANRDSFHFHGDPADYPVSAVLALPYDHKGETILRGRYQDPAGAYRAVQPRPLIADLIARLFRIKTLLDAFVVVVGAAAIVALALAVYLSLKLRADEIRTNMQLGAPWGFSSLQLTLELGLALALGAGLALGLAWAVQRWLDISLLLALA